MAAHAPARNAPRPHRSTDHPRPRPRRRRGALPDPDSRAPALPAARPPGRWVLVGSVSIGDGDLGGGGRSRSRTAMRSSASARSWRN